MRFRTSRLDRDAREALANLAAAYRQALQVVRLATSEGDADAAADWKKRAKKYREALRAVARGQDPVEVHARATGSRPFSRQ